MTHLTQPNKELTLILGFTANDGRSWELPFTYIMEPVISGNKQSWRSVPTDPDNEALFDLWCAKQYTGRNVGLWEAISVFKDNLYGLCIDNIASGGNRAHWLGLLDKIKNDRKLDIEMAKAYSMERLFADYGLESRYGQYLCPFHSDTNPSMSIHKKTNRFKCWSCGESGDSIDFVMKMNKCSFAEAVKLLT
jgi:hypothetical protein